MAKSTKKRNSYNQDVLKELQKKYGFSIDYITKSIRGDREGTIPTRIKKDYKTMESAVQIAIHKKVNNL